MVDPLWRDIQSTLLYLYSLPHNKIALQKDSKTPEGATKEKLDEIRTGFVGVPKKEGLSDRSYFYAWWVPQIAYTQGNSGSMPIK